MSAGRGSRQGRSLGRASPLRPPSSALSLQPSPHPFAIAGFSHYDGDRELPALREGNRLTLHTEPTNAHDMCAVENCLHRRNTKDSAARVLALALFAHLLAVLPLANCANAGVVFTTLFSFNGTNGAVPEAKLMQGTDGFLYGTTIGGGTNRVADGGFGTIFRFSTNGEFKTLVHLNYPTGSNPQSGLIQGTNGQMYGVTDYGGDHSAGVVYRMTPDGAFLPLHSFDWLDGGYPHGLTDGGDGSFYGTAIYGGTNAGSEGTVFKVTTEGVVTSLVSFNGENGAHPQCSLYRDGDGGFYGTTVNGGTNGDWGTVFRITRKGKLTTLVSFQGTNGAAPMSPPVRAADGCLYGTTACGGLGFAGTPYTGHGTVYRIASNGTFTTLVWFNNTNGSLSSFSGLLPASDGYLYGTTERGGVHQRGTLFRIATNGSLTTLVSFSPTDGREPSAGLVQVAEGRFYGVTMRGGEYDLGTIFQLTVTPDLPLLVIGRSSSNLLLLAWSAVAGREYQLQRNAGLEPTNWVNSGLPITATSAVVSTSVPLRTNRNRFYRVAVLP